MLSDSIIRKGAVRLLMDGFFCGFRVSDGVPPWERFRDSDRYPCPMVAINWREFHGLGGSGGEID